jgi:RNA polymerase sigma-70 factor (ECF subfamily)
VTDESALSQPKDLSQEHRWIALAVGGDSNAFARLYDSYVDAIYRFTFFRVSDEPLAEDLTSQVFLKAWEKLGNYEMRGLPFGAWLFRIARNLIADYYRARREVASLDSDDAVAVAAPDDVHSEVAQKVDMDTLLAKLEHLTDDQRQVLILKFVEGFATEEIAQVMGKNAGAIRALQMRGLQSLAELVET